MVSRNKFYYVGKPSYINGISFNIVEIKKHAILNCCTLAEAIYRTIRRSYVRLPCNIAITIQ